MEPDANAGDLAEQFGVTQSAVSRQLNLWKSMALFWHRFLFFHCYNVTKRASRFLGKPYKL